MVYYTTFIYINYIIGHSIGMLRSTVLRRMASSGDKATIEKARSYFKNFVENQKDMTPDLRSMVCLYFVKVYFGVKHHYFGRNRIFWRK